jgi:5-methyltetrahydrofolate--homocysteine methyltransferase
MSKEAEIRSALFEQTLAGNVRGVGSLTEEALAVGVKPADLLFEVLIPALDEVGRRFDAGDFFVPEMLMAAKAMQEAMRRLRPILAETGVQLAGTIMMMTVKGDVHDIGKNLCDLMLEGAGFQVVDLGVDVSPEKMIAAVREHHPPVIGFSALLTTTIPMFRTNIEALKKAGLRDQLKVIVGGAAATQKYADLVGADGYAPDASAAVRLVRSLVGEPALISRYG